MTPTLRFQATCATTAGERALLVGLARDTSSGLDPRYVTRRFGRYPLLATAWSGGDLLAFQLFDERRADGVRLTYIGPVFSRQGAYIDLFAATLRTQLASGEPFCIGMELESADAERALRRLLPTTAYPTTAGGSAPLGVATLARAFATAFDHITGLDEAHLRTEMKEPICPDGAPGHYQMMLVPCAGLYERRRAIWNELDAGIVSLDAHRARGRRTGAQR